jgi:hypothetical protein
VRLSTEFSKSRTTRVHPKEEILVDISQKKTEILQLEFRISKGIAQVQQATESNLILYHSIIPEAQVDRVINHRLRIHQAFSNLLGILCSIRSQVNLCRKLTLIEEIARRVLSLLKELSYPQDQKNQLNFNPVTTVMQSPNLSHTKYQCPRVVLSHFSKPTQDR